MEIIFSRRCNSGTQAGKLADARTTLAVSITCAVSMVAVFVAGCKDYRAADPSGSTPLAPRVSKTASDEPEHSLVKQLTQSYWKWSENDWQVFFRVMQSRGLFDLEVRDRRFAEIGRAVAASPLRSNLRVLTVENVNGDYNRRYSFAGLYFLEGRQATDVHELTRLGLASVTKEQWAGLEPPIHDLMSIGGNNGGTSLVYDDTDATVILYFDGTKWFAGAWFLLADLNGYPQMPETADGLRPETRAFVKILGHIADVSDMGAMFGGDRYWGLLTLYGVQKN